MTKILLRDAPGARNFINRLIDSAESIAIALTNAPDDEVRARLDETRSNLARDLSMEIGADTAAEMADIFCRAVMGERAERKQLAAMGLLT